MAVCPTLHVRSQMLCVNLCPASEIPIFVSCMGAVDPIPLENRDVAFHLDSPEPVVHRLEVQRVPCLYVGHRAVPLLARLWFGTGDEERVMWGVGEKKMLLAADMQFRN